MKKYALILNPMAGREKGRKCKIEILTQVEKALGKVDVYHTESAGHAQQISNDIKNNYSVIIVAGGDGTIHEVVNGMIHGNAALAVIPIGSGNDFIKMLNLPENINESIQIIKQNKRKRIDIGKIGERYFPNGLGIGFDAWVVKESKKVKRLRGFFIYLYAVLKTVFSFKNEPVSFYANGKTELKDIFLIAVGNGKAMGGGFYLNPEAIIDDGKFDVCIIHALKKREIFLHLPKTLKGKHTQLKQVETLRTDRLEIKSEKGIAVQADGELLGLDFKDINISILPKALEVVYDGNKTS